MSNLPQATPVNRLPMHNMMSKLHFFACLNIYFSLFFPWLHVLHPPDNLCAPLCREVEASTLLQVLEEYHCLYATIAMPPLRTSLHTCTKATHMHDTCRACGGQGSYGGFELVSPFYWVSFLFFSSHVHLHTLSTCIKTPPSHAPTLTWPEDEAAMVLSLSRSPVLFSFFFFWISLNFLYHTIICIYSNI